MASAEELNRMKARAEQTDKILAELQGQIEAIKKAAVREASRGEEEKLFKENEDLKKEIQSLKMALTLAEIGNGVRQVKMPTQAALSASVPASAAATATTPPAAATPQQAKPESDQKPKQEAKQEAGGKKAKTEKGGGGKGGNKGGEAKPKKGGQPAAADTDAPVDISRLDMRVGKIVGVEKHPDADSLYVEQVDLGEGKTRTIVSGLVKHVPISAMRDRVAVFMCNLKPAKMRGVLSEGMIMCAVSETKTEILVPPTDSVVGDKVVCAKFPGTPDGQLNPKKKIWETLKPDVRTNADRVATFKGAEFTIEGKGQVVAPTLADAQIS